MGAKRDGLRNTGARNCCVPFHALHDFYVAGIDPTEEEVMFQSEITKEEVAELELIQYEGPITLIDSTEDAFEEEIEAHCRASDPWI